MADSNRTTCLMAIDVCGFTRLSDEDEPRALRLLARLDAAIDVIAAQFDGRVFHKAGDGFLLEFSSSNNALKAATGLQETLAKDADRLDLRTALHVGEVQSKPDGDLLGHGVNTVSRLQEHAPENGLIFSEAFAQVIRADKLGMDRNRRKLALKHIAEPVIAYSIALDGKPLRRKRSRNGVKWSVAGLAAIILIGAWASTLYPRQPKQQVSQLAVRSVLTELGERNIPVESAVTALANEGSFADAYHALYRTYTRSASGLDASESVNLLHQIAILAHERDPEFALRIYRELIVVDPNDGLALLQLGRIHRARGEGAQAKAYIDTALNLDALPPHEDFWLRIEAIRMDAPPYEPAIKRMQTLANDALAADRPDISAVADIYSISLEFYDAHAKEAVTDALLDAWIARLKSDIAVLESLNLLHRAALGYNSLGLRTRQRGDIDGAIDYFKTALDLEIALERWEHVLNMNSNIAGAAIDRKDYELARKHNDEAFRVARKYDLTGKIYYNWLISAQINFNTGEARLACQDLNKAVNAWPQQFTQPEEFERYRKAYDCPA